MQNLMIPGIIVDKSNGSVTTSAGSATLYIDGREADFREIQSLRPKDISRVEYFDMPTGKYAKDASAINFIIKQVNNGGYTQIDALQGVGYLNGDYNIVSKYILGTKSLNLWAGYSLNNPKSASNKYESFNFEDDKVNRSTFYSHAGNKDSKEYIQASISNRGNKYIWMLRGGLAWSDIHNNIDNGKIIYSPDNIENILNLNNNDKSFRPSIYYYGRHAISKAKSLEYVIDGYYSVNNHKRLYNESGFPYNSLVKENYYYTKVNANYLMSLGHRNNLSFILYEFLRISDSNYLENLMYNQNLISTETILFADYSQRLGKFFCDVNPGLSVLSYRLKGIESINRITPRMQARMAYMINRKQQIQFSFALGNTYPNINTINIVEQQLDPIIILKGNPKMKNSILLNPRLSYNLNLNKIVLQTGSSYFYQNHGITSEYYIDNVNLISTFRDDCIYHRPGIDASVTYKPTKKFNFNVSGQWNGTMIRGGIEHHTISSFKGQAIVNFYAGDFSFSAQVSSPNKELINYQIERKTYWRYQLSTMWANGNLAVELSTNNLFLMRNYITEKLITHDYSFDTTYGNSKFNQQATLKIVYSLDYGKKTSKSPKYERVESESAILK
ncbi:MAG: outer membrane beta-barrel family protein [Muribaculaceae bacterium]|nr:outer membrane beta-barrel family protein [Muribaculaceae bacterium]